MSAFYLAIFVSLIFLLIACCAFAWSVYNKQFDDLEKSGEDIFFDHFRDDDKRNTTPVKKHE